MVMECTSYTSLFILGGILEVQMCVLTVSENELEGLAGGQYWQKGSSDSRKLKKSHLGPPFGHTQALPTFAYKLFTRSP